MPGATDSRPVTRSDVKLVWTIVFVGGGVLATVIFSYASLVEGRKADQVARESDRAQMIELKDTLIRLEAKMEARVEKQDTLLRTALNSMARIEGRLGATEPRRRPAVDGD